MDPIKVEKLQAMKRYRKIQLLQILFQYCLTLLVLALCFSKSVCVWFPSFCSFLEDFLLVTLPKLFACLMGPKCLFFLFNVILVVLVSQSKLGCQTATSPESDVYEEYMRRKRSLQGIPSMEESKKITKTVCSNEVIMERSEEEREDRGDKTDRLEEEEEPEEEEEGEGKEKEEINEKNDLYGEKEEDEEGENNEKSAEEEEEEGEQEEEDKPGTLPTDELTRRIEEFIARVNYQRRREAERLVCCG